MKFSEFSHIVLKILDAELPPAASILKECRSVADSIDIGRTAFMAEMGVGSELEYKRQCIKDDKIMFHAHIGLNSWQATAEALVYLNSAVRESGHVVDRAGICLDRRMGLPKEYRENIPSETGPMLESDQDWRQIAQAAPIQPHMGDFENCIAGLKEAGVDPRDPIQLLYVLKKLGPAVFEEMFGAGESNPNYARGRKPVIATDVFELSNRHADRYRQLFTSAKSKRLLKDRRILIASTDVHEHAVMIIHMLLAEAGAEPIYLGAEVNPDKVASAACSNKAEAILISTHNGMALEYARRLKDELDKHQAKIPVVMGGVLNQKVADQPLPIDVSADLKKLGYIACPRLEARFLMLLESGAISQDFNN